MLRNVLLLSSLLVAAAAAACGSENELAPGDPCKADQTCGDGLRCNFQAAEPTCLDGGADEDGDGLTNEKDLCPATAGGVNHDEDGDGQGDSCDACPIERWTANTKDGDGDGLAGQCDPDDREKGDKIAFFEGFGSPDALTGWMFDDAASFSVSNDALKVTVAGNDPSALATFIMRTVSDSSAAFVGYRVNDAAPAGVDGTSRDVLAGLFDSSPAGDTRAQCGASLTAQTSSLRLSTNGSGDVLETFPGLYAVNEQYRVLLQAAGTKARCVQTRGESSKFAESTAGDGLKSAVSLSVRSVNASFDYVLVVHSPLR